MQNFIARVLETGIDGVHTLRFIAMFICLIPVNSMPHWSSQILSFHAMGGADFEGVLPVYASRSKIRSTLSTFFGIHGTLLAHSSQNDDSCYSLSIETLKMKYGKDLLVSFSSVLKSLVIFSPTSLSGSLTSAFWVPSSSMRSKKPSSEMSSYSMLT